MTTEVRDRFLCRGEDGSEHIVIMYQRFTTKVATNNGSQMVIPGAVEYLTDQGLEVNPTNEPETFELVDEWKLLRRVM